MDIFKISTEQRNSDSMNIDSLSTIDMLKVINNEDKKVAKAVERELTKISLAVDKSVERFENGGRLIYIGAGTSGRLGALDAIELTPTYGVPPERAFGIIAGGEKAMFYAVEGAEDSKELAIEDLTKNHLSSKDVLISIAASGRTPYALSAIEYGNRIGALTIAITCTDNNDMCQLADIGVSVVVGPEVVTGSTRMKAGSAQKMVLNMLSTGIMIKTGKVYQNLMINVQATNEKLRQRSVNILSLALDIDKLTAEKLLKSANGEIPPAIVMYKLNMSYSEAVNKIEADGNRVLI